MPTSSPMRPNSAPHSQIEDGLALIIGTLIISFGMILMQHAGTLTGGTAGLALLIHYVTGIKFGILFFIINIPFYYLAFKRLGLAMTIKTVIAVLLLSLLTELHGYFFDFPATSIIYLTLLANVFMGLGFLILFRHRSSLGGVNLLALYLQDRYHIPAGKVQMGIDVLILLASMHYVDFKLLLISIAGAVVLNSIIAMNHRPNRYVA
ncbi:MAG: YitT family protein [Acinetobacter sp.]